MPDNKNIDHLFLWDHEYDSFFFFGSKKSAFGSVVTFTSPCEIVTYIKWDRKNGTYLHHTLHVH